MRLRSFALIGLAVAFASALLMGGGIGQFLFTFGGLAFGLLLSVAFGLVGAAAGYWTEARQIIARVAVLFAVLPVGLPLGWLVNRVDVARAKTWCERAVLDREEARWRPRLVDYDREASPLCIVYDRSSFMGYWELGPYGAWEYAD